jgi:hypothetical protein
VEQRDAAVCSYFRATAPHGVGAQFSSRPLGRRPALPRPFKTVFGDSGTSKLLILSQVLLSMQLPFAVIPLVQFVSSRDKMGVHAISRPVAGLAWAVSAVIVALNAKLLWDVFAG